VFVSFDLRNDMRYTCTHNLSKSCQRGKQRRRRLPLPIHTIQHQYKLPPPFEQPPQIHRQCTQILCPCIRPPINLSPTKCIQRIKNRRNSALQQVPSRYTFARMNNRKRKAGMFEVGFYDGGFSGGSETVGDEEGWEGEVLLGGC
jgi:hypothetical protein